MEQSKNVVKVAYLNELQMDAGNISHYIYFFLLLENVLYSILFLSLSISLFRSLFFVTNTTPQVWSPVYLAKQDKNKSREGGSALEDSCQENDSIFNQDTPRHFWQIEQKESHFSSLSGHL